MIHNPFRRDLILLHPPSLYDFRTRDTFLGPVADAVPSTTVFEMYPIGMTSIADFLERNHYNVEIINLAYRMLRDPAFDVPARIAQLDAPVFGIDLHWLPHVQGALAIAEIVKRAHPASRVLLGGLSATYYHEELIRNPSVDFVIRGDSTEEPVRQLLQAIRERQPLDRVANLTWKRDDGAVQANAMSFVPPDLDYVDVPAYRYLLRSMFKYRSLENIVPCLEWLRYPITVLLTARGCTEACAICGGSRSAYRTVCHRDRPAYRSPEKLVEDIRTIASFSRGPIFVVHDIRMGGMARATQFLSLLEGSAPANELVFEWYFPASDRFLTRLERSVRHWSAEITLESPNVAHRARNGKWPWANDVVEATIERVLSHGAETLDVFFMVGLPGQSYDEALAMADYCETLLDRFGRGGRLRPFVAPLGPFLDPGSRAFEDPAFGYRLFCRTLDDHRRAFLRPDWQQILSYETDAMSRDEIVRATYEVAERLNDSKLRHGVIGPTTHAGVASRLAIARRLLQVSVARRPMRRDAIELANHGTMFGDDELKWPIQHRFRIGATLLKSAAGALVNEVAHTIARAAGRFDVHPVVTTDGPG